MDILSQLLVLIAIFSAASSQRPMTALERRQQFQARDFVYDLLGSDPVTTGLGGTIRPMDVDILPSLQGEGVSYTLVDLEPCGVNLPHVHPRATEMIMMIRGQTLQTAFVEENGGRSIVNNITTGDVTFFPQGLIHYEQNFGCSNATFLSFLNSEDPGVVTISSQLFMIEDGPLSDSLGISQNSVRLLRRSLPIGPARGRTLCRDMCGLPAL